jgi:hypothetical protein
MPTEVTVSPMGGRLDHENSGKSPPPTRRVSRAAFRHYAQLLEEITGWARQNQDRVAKVYLASERGHAVRMCVIARTAETAS